jgi:arsenate reductase
MIRPRVLFLCTGNSARSQMAEGFLRHLAADRFEVESAGTEPSQVNPLAVAAMREIGIDISGHRSKGVDGFLAQPFAYVITVCDAAGERCPIFPGGAQRIHWSLPDPRPRRVVRPNAGGLPPGARRHRRAGPPLHRRRAAHPREW